MSFLLNCCKPYFDLCVEESYFNNNLERGIKQLFDYGYRTIAVNQIVEETAQKEPPKKKKKREPRETEDVVPSPYNVERLKTIADKLGCKEMKILTRLTVSFGHQNFIYKISKSVNFKKFDLIAALPTTDAALTFTCTNFEADIFAFDTDKKFALRFNKKMYNQLVSRGYFFEILYGPCIGDSGKRKKFIYMSHFYHAIGKSKNVIISGGLENYTFVRSPYDLINLGALFGLSESQSRSAVNEHPRRLILNSIGRRHTKAVIYVENLQEVTASDQVEINNMEVVEDWNKADADEPKLKKTKVK